jgi:phosphate starvation-inducible PhoH-like protein
MSKKPRLRVVRSGHGNPGEPRAGRGHRGRNDRFAAAPEPQRAESGQRYSRAVQAKSEGQAALMEAIRTHDMTFALGPAGSGKTYVAVALAVEALLAGKVRRIIFARPAVEAGERLGFLPGDMQEKVDPYMRPLYDALLDRVSPQQVKAWLAEKVIEIVPIGFMRGRTLSNAAVIIDEGQNATRGQMKMVLTRLGFGSFMVINGDPDQSDLDDGDSGLREVADQVDGKLPRVAVVRLDERDVVRHPVVRSLLPLLAAA